MSTVRKTKPATTRTGLWRTGPVSRLCRVLIAAVLGLQGVALLMDGIDGFAVASNLARPGFWIITGLAGSGLYDASTIGFGRRTGRGLVVGFAVLVVAGAGVAVVNDGTIWAAPTTWLIYGLDLAFLFGIAVALLISIVVGTPGCEIGAVREVVLRIRGRFDPAETKLHSCIAGLKRLDEWEARQPWRRPP